MKVLAFSIGVGGAIAQPFSMTPGAVAA